MSCFGASTDDDWKDRASSRQLKANNRANGPQIYRSWALGDAQLSADPKNKTKTKNHVTLRHSVSEYPTARNPPTCKRTDTKKRYTTEAIPLAIRNPVDTSFDPPPHAAFPTGNPKAMMAWKTTITIAQTSATTLAICFVLVSLDIIMLLVFTCRNLLEISFKKCYEKRM